MKSKWKVSSNPIGGETMFGVYRVMDTSKPDHSGNRETVGGYTASKQAAQILADRMNEGEEGEGSRPIGEMKKVIFREAERWTEDIYDCFEVTKDGKRPISQAECYGFINSLGVKCYGSNEEGYVVYGK